ncbi:hypothetical protein [Dyella terrae]|uniref:hypothetical protein n=1 Tax=Dyella terrae TaxID=522259 RepID=UPI001EFC6F48|nr:hypothetical protein [Dyella terrae]ULU26614.1 hypothetical protein DYST_03560 [Dyella terrae]
MHREEVEERKRRWQELWRTRFQREVSTIRPVYQGIVHSLLKRAYYAGTNDERRKHEPTQLGGYD